MSLKEYKAKRKFSKTPEPKGTPHPTLSPEGRGSLRFVVQKHQASHLHYDFRLEMDGILKSWAVPKGIPERAGIKHLAVMTEDHPLEYADFEGEIPEGEYGAGTVEIWDKGMYSMVEKTKKAYKFELHGEKLKGQYILLNFKDDKNWLLFKTKA